MALTHENLVRTLKNGLRALGAASILTLGLTMAQPASAQNVHIGVNVGGPGYGGPPRGYRRPPPPPPHWHRRHWHRRPWHGRGWHGGPPPGRGPHGPGPGWRR